MEFKKYMLNLISSVIYLIKEKLSLTKNITSHNLILNLIKPSRKRMNDKLKVLISLKLKEVTVSLFFTNQSEYSFYEFKKFGFCSLEQGCTDKGNKTNIFVLNKAFQCSLHSQHMLRAPLSSSNCLQLYNYNWCC